MNYNYFFVILTIILLNFNTGCSTFKKVACCSSLNQGNYLIQRDISNIYIGMTKQQIIYILGDPVMRNSFDNTKWYYISRQSDSNGKITQKILILTFNNRGILNNIAYKLLLKSKQWIK